VKVLTNREPREVVLVGNGANKYAKECNIPECSPEDLLVGRELDRYRAIKHKEREGHTPFHAKSAFGTVVPTTANAASLTLGYTQITRRQTGWERWVV